MVTRDTIPIVVHTLFATLSIETQNVWHSHSPFGCAEKLEKKLQAISLEDFPSCFSQVSTFLKNFYSSLGDEEHMEDFS